jgi:hypothetical protein
MSSSSEQARSLLSPRKIVLQVVAWLGGLALLAWVIHGAMQSGSVGGEDGGPSAWQRIRAADPWLIAALLGCTIASAIFNGSTFWITIQPLRQVRWIDMNLLNIFAGMLNYAPVRLGAVLRVAYHMRVDRLGVIQIGGWFALIGYVMFLGIGACVLASIIRPTVDLLWLALVLAQMAIGGALVNWFASIPLIGRHARGLDRLAANRRGLWGALALRLLDLGAFTGRMGAAMAILGMHLPPSHVVVLAMVALASSLTPLGKVGVREYCVAWAAARLSMEATDIHAAFKQLALLESAGEALVYIPLGVLATWWFRKRWRGASSAETNAAAGG